MTLLILKRCTAQHIIPILVENTFSTLEWPVPTYNQNDFESEANTKRNLVDDIL